MTISLDLVKQHLNYDDCDRDALIQQYTDAAIGWVEKYTGLSSLPADFASGDAPASLVSAVLLLVGHWFTNREGVVLGTIATDVPFAVEALCIQHRQVWVV
jgi:hypothetical protein